MGPTSRFERRSKRFVQWNESMSEDIDITNLIGLGSTIFGRKKKASKNTKSAAPAPGFVPVIRSALIVGNRRMVTSTHASDVALKTPPLPQQLPNRRLSSDTPTGTPSNRAVQTAAPNESDEEDDDFTSAPRQVSDKHVPNRALFRTASKQPVRSRRLSSSFQHQFPRRPDLWRKIQGKEPKPLDVMNRAWRSLKKELRNPATIRKSMLCNKANAAHTNFRRTGLSGEVGV